MIASACDFGPRETIRHGRNGLLVPSEDVDALRSALDALLDDQDLAGRLGAAAREAARDYSVARSIATYAAVFERHDAKPRLRPETSHPER